jgi:hypothetical protein
MEGSPEIKEFVMGFIFAIIGIIVGANLLTPLQNATGSLPAQYSWVGGILLILAVVGILMFGLKAFKIW